MDEDAYQRIQQEAYEAGRRDGIQAVQEGRREHTKESAKTTEIMRQKMSTLAQKSHIVLFRANTVFPFDFFPDTLVIDTVKVSIIQREFFASEYVTSILLKDVTDVIVERSLFLANLKITYSHHPMRPIFAGIRMMKHWDAFRAKEILEGMLVVHREGIDLSKINPETVITFIENLGKSKVSEYDSVGT